MTGIRDMITNELGLDANDPYTNGMVNTLIEGYSRNHEGNVSPNGIINDIRTAAGNIVDNIARASEGYDFRHEVLDCGKDRQEAAIDTFSKGAADECLPNRYWENISNWTHAIYEVAGNVFEERAFRNGIEGYRDFEKGIPCQNIHAIAEALGKEDETVKFLAENGTEKDFRDYMIDVRMNPDHPDDVEEGAWTSYSFLTDPLDNGHNGSTVHGCPRDLSDRIFPEVSDAVENGTFMHFDRDGIMREMTAIHRADGMTNEEKIDVQNACIKSGCTDRDYPRDVSAICRSDVENKADILTRYFESSDDHYKNDLMRLCRSDMKNKNEAIHDFISIPVDQESSTDLNRTLDQELYPDERGTLIEKLDSMVEELREKFDGGSLTIEKFVEIRDRYGFSGGNDDDADVSISEDGLTAYLKGSYNPVTEETACYTTDGSGLNDIISALNSRERDDTDDMVRDVVAMKGKEADVSFFGIEGRFVSLGSFDETFAVRIRTEEKDSTVAFKYMDGEADSRQSVFGISCNAKQIDGFLSVKDERSEEEYVSPEHVRDVRSAMMDIAGDNGAVHAIRVNYIRYDESRWNDYYGRADYYVDGNLLVSDVLYEWEGFDSCTSGPDFMQHVAEHEDGIAAASERAEADGPYSSVYALLCDVGRFEDKTGDAVSDDEKDETDADGQDRCDNEDINDDGGNEWND